MDESTRREIPAPPPPVPDLNEVIASLRAAGADRFDPVRWHYIEVLAKRASAQQGGVKRVLDASLEKSLAALKDRLELARSQAAETLNQVVARYPDAADELQLLFAAGDFNGLRRTASAFKSAGQGASLGALVRQLNQSSREAAEARSDEGAGPHTELKTIRQFRNTWSKLSADNQVAQALRKAPRNAGPINSHMLVLRSLALMREISPDYLNRFMSYANTLLSLDQSDREKPAGSKKQQGSRGGKK